MSANSWYKKELCFGKKTRNGNNLKIKFQQRRVKPKCSLDKKTKILQILYKFFLLICNNFSEEICLSKPVFNNTSRRNHSSLISNTVTKKIKYFSTITRFKTTNSLKKRWHYFVFWSVITTKLDTYVCKNTDDYIFNGLLQAFCFLTINIWFIFLAQNKSPT